MPSLLKSPSAEIVIFSEHKSDMVLPEDLNVWALLVAPQVKSAIAVMTKNVFFINGVELLILPAKIVKTIQYPPLFGIFKTHKKRTDPLLFRHFATLPLCHIKEVANVERMARCGG
jgi:hypothetical protein